MKSKFDAEVRPSLKDLTIVPAPGMLLIRRIKAGIAKRGIVVPRNERDENYLAEVMAVSPISKIEYGVAIPSFVSKGAIVVLTTYASGQNLSESDGEFQLIQESHVAGVVGRKEYDDALAAFRAANAEQSAEGLAANG